MSYQKNNMSTKKSNQNKFFSLKSYSISNQKKINYLGALINQSDNQSVYQMFNHSHKSKFDRKIQVRSTNIEYKRKTHNISQYKKAQRSPIVARESSFDNKIRQLRKQQQEISEKQSNKKNYSNLIQNILQNKEADRRVRKVGSKQLTRNRRNYSSEIIGENGQNCNKSQKKEFLAMGSTCGVNVSINWKKREKQSSRKNSLAKNVSQNLFQQDFQDSGIEILKNQRQQSEVIFQPMQSMNIVPKFTPKTNFRCPEQALSRQNSLQDNPQNKMIITSFKSQLVTKTTNKQQTGRRQNNQQGGKNQFKATSQSCQRSKKRSITIEEKAIIAKAKGKCQFNPGKYKVNLINLFSTNMADNDGKNSKQMALSNLNKFYDFCLKTLQKDSKKISLNQVTQICQRERYQQLIALTQSFKNQTQKTSQKNQNSFSHQALLGQLYPISKGLYFKSFKRYAQKQQNNEKLAKINLKVDSQRRTFTSEGNHNQIYKARTLKKKQAHKDNVKKKDQFDDVGAWQINVPQQL